MNKNFIKKYLKSYQKRIRMKYIEKYQINLKKLKKIDILKKSLSRQKMDNPLIMKKFKNYNDFFIIKINSYIMDNHFCYYYETISKYK